MTSVTSTIVRETTASGYHLAWSLEWVVRTSDEWTVWSRVLKGPIKRVRWRIGVGTLVRSQPGKKGLPRTADVAVFISNQGSFRKPSVRCETGGSGYRCDVVMSGQTWWMHRHGNTTRISVIGALLSGRNDETHPNLFNPFAMLRGNRSSRRGRRGKRRL